MIHPSLSCSVRCDDGRCVDIEHRRVEGGFVPVVQHNIIHGLVLCPVLLSFWWLSQTLFDIHGGDKDVGRDEVGGQRGRRDQRCGAHLRFLLVKYDLPATRIDILSRPCRLLFLFLDFGIMDIICTFSVSSASLNGYNGVCRVDEETDWGDPGGSVPGSSRPRLSFPQNALFSAAATSDAGPCSWATSRGGVTWGTVALASEMKLGGAAEVATVAARFVLRRLLRECVDGLPLPGGTSLLGAALLGTFTKVLEAV
ncbi:hypothetical protein FB45DRAFT_104587 [Roridomyces roridus]|uniref:Uncharacterized protein n=1 Tax=Roridomyces roridus TaxID=1738132 RepID=A0AAD7BK88_9AGAR|nr:hypothetical protein FB45DRAFT_104587 [Roridomyces roridus]